jgi:hypothetical protein
MILWFFPCQASGAPELGRFRLAHAQVFGRAVPGDPGTGLEPNEKRGN